MQKISRIALTLALSMASQICAQNRPLPATDVTNAAIQAALKKTVGGEYNVGLGIIHRAKMAAGNSIAGLVHSKITEVYHIVEGNATIVTGGVSGCLMSLPSCCGDLNSPTFQ